MSSRSLHEAAFKGNLKRVRQLVGSGKASVNAKDKGGSSPLHHAAHRGHAAVITYLLSVGAEVDIRDGYAA